MEVEGRAVVGGQARNKLVRIAADDVDFGAVGKADARPPGPDIEAAVVADREAALDRGFLVRLAEAAEEKVADDGRGDRNGDTAAVFFFLGMGGRRNRGGGETHAAARAGALLHARIFDTNKESAPPT